MEIKDINLVNKLVDEFFCRLYWIKNICDFFKCFVKNLDKNVSICVLIFF